MKKNRFILLSVASAIAILGIGLLTTTCTISGGGTGEGAAEGESEPPTPINLSVFLDLSDRLDSTCNGNFPVSQVTRDTAAISTLVDYFIATCVEHKISENRNHFQILFHPAPNASDIATLAANLNVDMDKISEPRGKKERLMSMKDDFSKSLSLIYTQTLREKNFVGSDIWGFFCSKNAKVDNLCLRKGYRNILVILTDGYIYHADNKQQEGNAFTFILPRLLDNVPDLSLLAPRQGLNELEVLMLEINPVKPTQQGKLISVLEDWLVKMGVEHHAVYETDMPSNTRTIIDNFLKAE